MAQRFTHHVGRMFGVVLASWIMAGAAWSQTSIAGRWTLDVDSPQGVMKVALALSVDGETLKGTIASDMGETPFTGTVKDGAIKFSFDFAGPQGPMSVTTTGTVTGDDIKGEMDYGMGVAPFTGKRAEQ